MKTLKLLSILALSATSAFAAFTETEKKSAQGEKYIELSGSGDIRDLKLCSHDKNKANSTYNCPIVLKDVTTTPEILGWRNLKVDYKTKGIAETNGATILVDGTLTKFVLGRNAGIYAKELRLKNGKLNIMTQSAAESNAIIGKIIVDTNEGNELLLELYRAESLYAARTNPRKWTTLSVAAPTQITMLADQRIKLDLPKSNLLTLNIAKNSKLYVEGIDISKGNDDDVKIRLTGNLKANSGAIFFLKDTKYNWSIDNKAKTITLANKKNPALTQTISFTEKTGKKPFGKLQIVPEGNYIKVSVGK